jgi:hypothetical protein
MMTSLVSPNHDLSQSPVSFGQSTPDIPVLTTSCRVPSQGEANEVLGRKGPLDALTMDLINGLGSFLVAFLPDSSLQYASAENSLEG